MHEIPAELILSESSLQAGVAALERVHGRHLEGMTDAERQEARTHYRDQVEHVLAAVQQELLGVEAEQGGRATILLTDHEDRIEVSAQFVPDLREVGEQEVEGTPAQLLALAALEAISAEAEEDEGPEGYA
jgi:hypothetical protein